MRGRGSVWKRCSKCGGKVTDKSCNKCGGDRWSWATVVYVHGKQRWKSGFATKTAAQAHVNDVLARANAGNYVAPSRVTLGHYLEQEWLPAVEAEVEPTTFVVMAGHVRNYLAPSELGAIQLDRLTTEAIRATYGRLLTHDRAGGGAPLSKATVQRVHSTLHTALEALVDTSRLPTNPAHKAKPKAKKSEARSDMRVWTFEQLQCFLGHVSDDRLFPLWRLLAFTGMRRGEAAALTWADFDFTTSTLVVRRAIGVAGYKTHVSAPKSGKARAIALDEGTAAALRAFQVLQKKERLALGLPQPETQDRVFVRGDGEPIHPERISKGFEAHVRSSGLPRIRLHDLRHTHASHLIASGVNIKIVAERLGHSNVLTTLNTYAHLMPTSQQEAVDRLAVAYAGADR